MAHRLPAQRKHPHRFVLALTACIAVAAGLPAAASADSDDPPARGEHIANCARVSLPPAEDPPTITCEHDGHVHTFANFGVMVLHMLEEGG